MIEAGRLRIGELSRRAGVSPELLRAWERRYGLLRPTRSPGGLRLYSTEDLERVERMQRLLAEGLAAAEAAALASARPIAGTATPVLDPSRARSELAAALDCFDEPAANEILDRLFAAGTVEAVLLEIVLPYLRNLGDRWAGGEVSVAQEHFASSVVRGRLLGLARGWGRGAGPLALLACLPGERHDLGLMAFGLALRSHGWRIAYLGSDTPLETVAGAADRLGPDIVVLSGTSSSRIEPVASEVRALARRYRVGLGGEAAAEPPTELGVVGLRGDPIAEAAHVARLLHETE